VSVITSEKAKKVEKENKQALIVSILAVALVAAIFVFPLPPSPTFFDGIGRISLVYGVAATCIWTLMERESRSFRNVMYGSFSASFFGTILGLFFEYLFSLFKS